LRLRERHSPLKIVIEDKGSGISLIQDLKSEYIWEIEAYSPNPGMDKMVRFSSQSIKFERGQVYLQSEAPWLDAYLRELLGFPGSKFDDQVDSTSQALEAMSSYADAELTEYVAFQAPYFDFLAGCFLDQLPERLIGDKAYDSDALDQTLAEEYGVAMISPNRRNRKQKTQDGRPLRRYRRRWKVDGFSPGCTTSDDSSHDGNTKSKTSSASRNSAAC
jgi:predicted phage terminase large subunit-like protein